MSERYNSRELKHNYAFKGRRTFTHKRPRKGRKKQSRVGDDPKHDKPYSFEEDDNIAEDSILDDYYTGDEDDFEKFTRRK